MRWAPSGQPGGIRSSELSQVQWVGTTGMSRLLDEFYSVPDLDSLLFFSFSSLAINRDGVTDCSDCLPSPYSSTILPLSPYLHKRFFGFGSTCKLELGD